MDDPVGLSDVLAALVVSRGFESGKKYGLFLSNIRHKCLYRA